MKHLTFQNPFLWLTMSFLVVSILVVSIGAFNRPNPVRYEAVGEKHFEFCGSWRVVYPDGGTWGWSGSRVTTSPEEFAKIVSCYEAQITQ